MSVFVWAIEFWGSLKGQIGKEIAQFLAAIFFFIVIGVARFFWRLISRCVDYFRRLGRAKSAVARIKVNGHLREGAGLWLTGPVLSAKAADFKTKIEASRILVVANAKGGVGKTTVSANLGARLAEILPKPVLMVDLDFQGTLSSMTIATQGSWVPPKGQDSRATHLISGDLSVQDIAHVGVSAALQPNLKIITSFYDLAQAENRVMIEWLIGDRKKDVRFNLANVLLDPAVRDAYSLIIIDSPPRFTTSAIQALATATHLLIPTVLDDPSSEAVVTFIRNVETFKSAGVCPHIKYLGVVGSIGLTTENTDEAEGRLLDRLQAGWADGGAGGVTTLMPKNTYLPRAKFFRNAVGAGGIAYSTMGDAQDAQKVKGRIISLAAHVKQEMRL